ncbi:MAG: efflux RND transporter periplasmic adaptor subunit [Acidobacteriota bacterium]
MDVKREGVAKRRRIKWAFLLLILAAGLGYAGFRISKLEPAAPTVDFATLWPDTVKRGPMVRDVKGLGTLVPEEIVWIAAKSEGQVDKISRKSGEQVHPDTVLVVLTNPDLDLQANDLEWQIKQAEANLTDLRVRLKSQRFDSEAALSRYETALEQAELNMDRKQQLFNAQIEPEINVREAVAKWKEARNSQQAESKKLEILEDSQKAQIENLKVQIDKLKATWDRKRQQVRELTIRAGVEGVLQEFTLQVGQRISPGATLAKVAQPSKLKAELKIAETQAKDILLGQKASVDTRNGIIPAHVIRIDPNVVNGTRTVDCALDGPLPSGAVPDLSVDGTIEIERLTDVLFIGRPVFGQPNSQVSLFKISGDGKAASRVTVKLGRGSVTSIEVLGGLNLGDRVILSDMSEQDKYQKIQFK